MRSGVLRWCWMLIGVVLALMADRAEAQFGSVGRPVATCIRPAEPGLDPRVLLRSPAGFDCRTPQTAFGSGDYLIVSGPVGAGADWPARVRMSSLWQDRITLHALYADGRTATMRADARTRARRMQLGAFLEFKVPMRDIEVVRLLWHVEGAVNLRGVVLDARIASPRESARSNTVLAALYGGFAALCLTLLISNLALWGALRHRFQLYYCAMLVALIANAASASGALTMISGLSDLDALRLTYVSHGATGITALLFARAFFEPRVFAGWLGRLATGVILLIASASVLFAAFEPVHPTLLDRFFSSSFAALIALIPMILWRAHAVRSRFLWVFCVTWGVPIAFGTARVAHTFGLVRWSFLLDNSSLVAMTAEAVLSSLAIAYRIHLLSRDRDRARADEGAALILAATDPLTGLLNRRAFLAQAIGRAGPQTLLILDLDHFKQVNETIGHDGGDEVLRLVALFLREMSPPGALVARIGGEEFAIVLDAGTPIDPVRLLVELRARQMPYDLDLTASIGVSTGPLASEIDWKALYRTADQALFDAKASGRDRVRRAAGAFA